MVINRNTYHSPLEDRYYAQHTSSVFSDQHRYITWRRLWVLLAEAEKECGLDITDDQIKQMRSNMYDIPYERVNALESETHHDVVAHLRAFAEQCPDAAPIIHLGATSCYITDNTDVMLMDEAIDDIKGSLKTLIDILNSKAMQYKDVPIVGRTHFQPAQPVTLGKRMALWIQDFKTDLDNLVYQHERLTPLGCRGATGTADSFMQLFNGNIDKVKRMEQIIVKRMGFDHAFPVSGQTYPRKQDYYIMQVLSGMAQSASKMATDIRLMAGLDEVSESFGTKQVGSSAMPYKKNPITCEKVCGLARYIIVNTQNTAWTASSQWLERTLDDSSNRKMVIPEMFIATENMLDTCYSIINDMVVNTSAIKQHLQEQSIKTVAEAILSYEVKNGGDRQKLHEKLREYTTSKANLVVKVADDPCFSLNLDEVMDLYREHVHHPSGLSAEQVDEYINSLHELS